MARKCDPYGFSKIAFHSSIRFAFVRHYVGWVPQEPEEVIGMTIVAMMYCFFLTISRYRQLTTIIQQHREIEIMIDIKDCMSANIRVIIACFYKQSLIGF